MPPTRLYLHFGAHKTATTSLQYLFLRHRWDLLRQGVRYVPVEEVNASGLVALLHAGAGAEARGALGRLGTAGMPGGSLKRRAERVADRLWRLARGGGGSLLVSHESFFSHAGDPTQHDVYPTLERALALFREVSPFDEVRAVFALREPSAFLNSVYTQNLTVLYTGEFAGFLERVDPARLAWDRVVERTEEALGAGNCTWVPYEMVRTRGGAAYLQVFLDWLGVRLPGAELPRRNESLSATAARMLQASGLTYRNLDAETRGRLITALKQVLPEGEFGKAAFVTPEDTVRLAEALRPRHEPLLRRLPLFDDDIRGMWGY